MKAAGVAFAELVCHRDTWEYLTGLSTNQTHFRTPPSVDDVKDGRVQAALSGRSLIALLIALWETRDQAEPLTADWALAATAYSRIARYGTRHRHHRNGTTHRPHHPGRRHPHRRISDAGGNRVRRLTHPQAGLRKAGVAQSSGPELRQRAGPECCAESEVELDVVDVGELHDEAVGTAATVLEVLLLKTFGRDVLQLLLRGTSSLRVEQPGRVLRWQVLGGAPDPPLVGGAGCRSEPEPGPGLDDDPGRRRSLPLRPLSHPRQPVLAHPARKPGSEFGARSFDGSSRSRV